MGFYIETLYTEHKIADLFQGKPSWRVGLTPSCCIPLFFGSGLQQQFWGSCESQLENDYPGHDINSGSPKASGFPSFHTCYLCR